MPEHEPIPGDSERGQPLDPEYADPMPSMSIPSAKPAAIPPAGLPEQLGAYRIVRLIGIGGMGAVYEAQQASPHRTVALKVLRPGLAMESMLQRFKREAEILGRLQHVGIAQIYEANSVSTPQGDVPFFAMELIRGLPLNEYVHRNLLPARDCLVLLAKICDAVHYAHEMGVIHRDLKPGNILVDASGQPKVLDFGVARITDCDIQATTLQTTTGQIIGTLQYMAPEQAAGNQAALDTRCDVYALGIIAYELLVGQAPYDLSRLAIQEAVRIICEEEPTRISSINRSLRGDIETIIAKALAKEKDRRYQSALELAADIRRYLSDEPILARPPSAAYQLAKFARRNRTLVGGIAAVFLVLVLGVIGTSLGMLRARSHQAIAEKERDRATNSEQNVRRLLAASYADAAELARQRGQWQSALSNYNQAIAADTEGDMRLRIGLGKAEVLEALRRTKEAYDEVRWVAEHDVSQRYRAQILLLRGLLPHLFKTEDPNSLLREAISAGLQPADEALAQGLLAPRAPEAIAHLQRALQLDRREQHAYPPLLELLIVMGNLDEAKETLRVWTILYPDDPIQRFYAALIELLDGKEPRFDTPKNETDSFPAEYLAPLRSIAEEVKEIRRLVAQPTLIEALSVDKNDDIRIFILVQRIGQACEALRAMPNDYGAHMPLSKWSLELQAQYKPAMAAAEAEKYDEAIPHLDRLLENWPVGVFYLFRGIMAHQAGRWEDGDRDLMMAAQVPSGFGLDVRRPAAEFALSPRLQRLMRLVGDAPGIDSTLAASLREDVRRSIFRFGKMSSDVALQGLELARIFGDEDLMGLVCQAAVKPSNLPDFWLRCLRVHAGVGNYGQAIALADRILAMDPALDEAKEWRQLALDRLGGIGPSAHPRPLRMHTETLRRDCPVSSSVALTPLVLLESKQHAVIGEPANRITCAAFTPDGQYVVSGSASGELCLWSLATGKVSRRFTGLPSSARAVAVSGDGRFVAASAGKENNGSVKIWGIASTEEVLRISASAEALEFCDADRALYVRDGEVARAIDLMSLKNRVADGAPATRPSADAVPAMRLWPESVLSLRKHSATTALSPNGLIAACAEGTNVEFWDLQAGQPWHRLKGDESTLAAMVFSPDGRALLSIGENGTLRLWQLPDWLPRLRNAIEHLKQAGQQYSPASLLLRQQLAVTLLRQNKTDEAVELWRAAWEEARQAIKPPPQAWEIRNHLIVALRLAGETNRLAQVAQQMPQQFAPFPPRSPLYGGELLTRYQQFNRALRLTVEDQALGRHTPQCARLVDLAWELGWCPDRATETEIAAMRDAMEYVYRNPSPGAVEQQNRAAAILAAITLKTSPRAFDRRLQSTE